MVPGEDNEDAWTEKVPFEPEIERNSLGVRDRDMLGYVVVFVSYMGSIARTLGVMARIRERRVVGRFISAVLVGLSAMSRFKMIFEVEERGGLFARVNVSMRLCSRAQEHIVALELYGAGNLERLFTHYPII